MRFRLCNPVLRSVVLATGIGCVISAPVLGQDSEFNDELPRELEGVTIVEHLDEQLPLDLEFIQGDFGINSGRVQDSSRMITMSDYFFLDRGPPARFTQGSLCKMKILEMPNCWGVRNWSEW